MQAKNLIFFLLIFIYPGIYAQNQPAYNDTSYFIPFDEDFNMIISASKGHLANVKNLLDRGADINAVTVDNISALMYAAENGDIEMVRFLLQNGADPNIRPFNGVTALISAAKLNYQQIVELLINNDAKINAADEEGVTAIHYATAYNYPDLVELLLYYDADPKIPDKNGTPPVITAAYNNSLESLEILINNGVDINSQDKQDYTPLMVAIQEQNPRISRYLLEQDANIDLTNKGGMSALAFAIKNGDYDMTERLIDSGANVNQRISGNMNMLTLAIESGEEEITDLLISEGATLTYRPSFNELGIGPGFHFNADDFFTSLDLSLNDSRFNTGINAGFNFRPAAVRILTDPVNDTLFQYWERRYYFYAGLEKRFAVIKPFPPSESGPFIGVRTAYTFGGYRGSDTRPDPGFLFSPRAGWYMRNNWLTLKFSYEYLNFNIENISPHRFNISFAFSIPLANKRLMEKEIEWLQYE